jgi:hypothetical protein
MILKCGGGVLDINNKLIKNPTNLILGLLIALVFALDIFTTQIGLTNGLGYEMNPFMRAVIENPVLTILVKGIALCLIIFFVNYITKRNKNIGYLGMCVVIGITLGAVINNLLVIL